MMRKTLAAITILGFAVSAAFAQTPTPVPQLNLNRLSGQFYEIARLPNKPEKKCVGNAIALYDLGDKMGRFQVVWSCLQKDNYVSVRNSDGRYQLKRGTDGRLKLGSFWPLFTKYWVLGIAPDNSWMLVGTPNHKKLWIYAKDKALAPDVLAELKSKAGAQGYDVANLVMGPQAGGQVGTLTVQNGVQAPAAPGATTAPPPLPPE